MAAWDVPAAGLRAKSTRSSTPKVAPFSLRLTGGQVADCTEAGALMDELGEGDILLADKGYDSNAIRAERIMIDATHLKARGTGDPTPPPAYLYWISQMPVTVTGRFRRPRADRSTIRCRSIPAGPATIENMHARMKPDADLRTDYRIARTERSTTNAKKSTPLD